MEQAVTEATTTKPTEAAFANCANLGLRLEGFSDASFTPFGGRSYGASVIALNGSVVAWKCGKQAPCQLQKPSATRPPKPRCI